MSSSAGGTPLATRDALAELGSLDQLAHGDSFIHRLDPRAKLVATVGFILAVVSFDRYAIAPLVAFTAYPLVVLVAGGLPLGRMVRAVAFALPFALMIGLGNVLVDSEPMYALASPWGVLTLSGGWVSLISIVIRFSLTVAAALTLVATTGFDTMCAGLSRLGVPKIFVGQLQCLYRYMFVLADEARRMHRAREMRACGRRGRGLRVTGQMLGQLLLRSMDRARRIHSAMLCRGFDGELRVLRHFAMQSVDWGYMGLWLAVFGLARSTDLVSLLGATALRGLQ